MPTDLDDNFPLSYRERNQEIPINTDVGISDASDFPASVFEGPDDPVTFSFTITPRQFTAILSSIDVGGPLAYTDDGFLPYFWFIAAFAEAFEMDCSDILHCLQNSESIREFLDSLYLGDDSVDQTSSNMNIFPTNECDYDKIFGQASALVTMLHTTSIDLFQAIEEGTNALERADLLVSAIPAIGALIPVDELLGFVDDLIENGYEDYQSAYDTTEYDELRCGLFCLAKTDCSLSIDQAILYYGEFLEYQLTDPSTLIRNLVQFIATGGYPTDDIIYVMHLLVLTLIKSKADLFGINFSRLGLTLATANPDPDWAILCTECPVEYCVSLIEDANGFYAADEDGNATSAFGGHIFGEGMAPNQDTGGWNIGAIASSIPDGNITAIRWTFNQETQDVFMARFGSDDFQTWSGLSTTQIMFTEGNTTGYFPFSGATNSVRITTSTNIAPKSLRLIEVCFFITPV